MNAPAPCKPVIRESDDFSVGGILGAAAGMAGGPVLGKVAGAALRGAAGAISKGLGAAGRAIGRGIDKASKSVTRSNPSAPKGAGRFTEIGSGLSKADARALVRGGNSGLTEAQAASILKKLGKGRVDSVGIKTVNRNGNVRLTFERAGAQSGFQRFSFEIGADGKTLRIVQTAFDDAGNLVRQTPGAARNNLFDVK